MELRLKIVSKEFRDAYPGNDYLRIGDDGKYRAFMIPSLLDSPEYLIYELSFNKVGGSIIDIVRYSSLGYIPALLNKKELLTDKTLIDEVNNIIKEHSYRPIIQV